MQDFGRSELPDLRVEVVDERFHGAKPGIGSFLVREGSAPRNYIESLPLGKAVVPAERATSGYELVPIAPNDQLGHREPVVCDQDDLRDVEAVEQAVEHSDLGITREVGIRRLASRSGAQEVPGPGSGSGSPARG